MTDYFGIHLQLDRLEWVNEGTNAVPSSGQTNRYTLFGYDSNGRLTSRERKYATGALGLIRQHTFQWDADDRLHQSQQWNGTQWVTIFTALYDGDGLRVRKTETWPGLPGGGTLTHDYSWGPGGIVHDTANGGTVYTPGLHHQTGTTDRFYHSDWLGSTRYLSDGTGASLPSALRYDAFGNRSATGGTDAYHSTDFQFAGAGWGYQQEWASATEPVLGLQYLEQRCAPQYRALNPWFNQERFGRNTFGSTDYLTAKAQGNHRLSVTRRELEDV